MADSISNSPRNGALGWLADALASARAAGDAVDLKSFLPSLLRDRMSAEPQGLGSTFMGKMPEEVDNWAYGNAPMVMPPAGTGGYVPHFKPGRAESVADTLFGGQVASPLVRAGVGVAKVGAKAGASALQAVGDSMLQPVPRSLAQQGAVRLKGGNFNTERLNGYLSNIGVDPQDGLNDAVHQRHPAVDAWGNKQLRNYIAKDLGSTTDPLLAVEKEYPDLHLPEGELSLNGAQHLYNNRRLHRGVPIPENVPIPDHWDRQPPAHWHDPYPNNTILNDQYDTLAAHEALTKDPLTAWGKKSSASLYGAKPQEYIDELSQFDHPFEEGDATSIPEWLRKAPPETKIWGLEDPHTDSNHFGHVLDYLEAATEPHRSMRGLYGDGNVNLNFAYRNYHPDVIPKADQDLAEILRTGDPGMAPFARDRTRRWQALNNAGLLLSPEQLARTSVADAVKKTAQWNQYMASKSAGENLAKGNVPFKQYPDGHQWVKFGMPENQTLPEGVKLNHVPRVEVWDDKAPGWHVGEPGDEHATGEIFRSPERAVDDYVRRRAKNELDAGLNAEGDAMGHCVGGYCDEVAENGTQIYSLRDGKNAPHVTVEVRPGRPDNNLAQEWRAQHPDAYKKEWAEFELSGKSNGSARLLGDRFNDWLVDKGIVPRGPDEIVQIKGKGNEAPVEKYLPHVQDFVKSGNWGRVGDLKNSGLYDLMDDSAFANPHDTMFRARPELNKAQRMDMWNEYIDNHSGHRYASQDDVLKFWDEAFPKMAPDYQEAWKTMGQGRNYASGGSVLPRYCKKAILFARIKD